ncbi:MAG: acetolactate synthase [Actinomycetota bacterium]|nr:acetolactate synthase [Actinomycetota bacterium]
MTDSAPLSDEQTSDQTAEQAAEHVDAPRHGGHHAVDAAVTHGARALFTLSGAHIFPLFDAAVGGSEAVKAASTPREAERQGRLPLIDVRHEQTAVFAAEAVGKLSRTPGFAAVTAGPGVTNAMSAVTGAWMNGSPLVLIGGRAPNYRWGSGALQELDHVPLLAPVTKKAWTIHDPTAIADDVAQAFELAAAAHRGPVFIDIPMDVLFTPAAATSHPRSGSDPREATKVSGPIDRVVEALAAAEHPVLIVGSDVWAGDAIEAVRQFTDRLPIPTIANGMGRGVLSPDNPLLVTRARSRALKEADLVVVVGAPLDFRLGYGRFGGEDAAAVIHLVDSATQVATHVPESITVIADLSASLTAVLEEAESMGVNPRSWQSWSQTLHEVAEQAWRADEAILHSGQSPIHPARIYGEIRSRLAADDIVIGDGGDFVSFAGRFIEPQQPGCWLDPGPFGCLGTGPGYALGAHVARPDSHPWLLMGDGAAGFSLMDVESLVRHNVPVTMIVGNNSGWGLERHPMRFLYGYDVVADLPALGYDDVVRALGGAGETVTDADHIGAALDRARAYQGPYLVNVLTDPEIAYPRSTTGV